MNLLSSSSAQQQQTTHSTPGILGVMGDFSDIWTLVLVSRCSKQAKEITNPYIESKKQNKQAMFELVCAVFPTLDAILPVRYAPDGDYYYQMIETYFNGNGRPLVVVSHKIGNIIENRCYRRTREEMVNCLDQEMKSSHGRKTILDAIQGWRLLGPPYDHSQKLRFLEDTARLNFSIRRGKIDSSFGSMRYTWTLGH